MYLTRAILVWLVIIVAESVHGTLRQILVSPVVGDFRARQIAVFSGMLLIFAVTWAFIRRIAAPTRVSLLAVGAMWVILTVLFEMGLGIIVLDYSWERVVQDYDLPRGGLMSFGLLFMLFAPTLADRLRGKS